MTDEELAEIEEVLQGDDEPETDWWFTKVVKLIAEIRRLKKEQLT